VWDKGVTYYSQSLITSNFYDVKLYNAGTWLTLYDNAYFTYAAAVNYDSLKAYIIVDSTTMRWVGDSLAVYLIDSTEITNKGISDSDLSSAGGVTGQPLVAQAANAVQFAYLDSTGIKNAGINGVDLNSTIITFQPDSGISINGANGASLTYNANGTYNFDIYADQDTAFDYETRKLVLKDGGAATGIKHQKFNTNVWDTLRHSVADYYWLSRDITYALYDSDSISVSDTVALNAAQYYGTYRWIDPDGTSSGNLQTYTAYFMVEPSEYQYAWGADTGDPTNILTFMYRGTDTDSIKQHFTFDIYNLIGSNVDSAPDWYYPSVANTWETVTLTSTDLVLTSLLNEPFVVKITAKVSTSDTDYTLDLAYFKFMFQTQ
jgi:hypothetical protein